MQEALGTLTHAYYAAPEETLVALKALLLENVEKVFRVFPAHLVFTTNHTIPGSHNQRHD